MRTRTVMAVLAASVALAIPAAAQAAPSFVDVGTFDTPMYVTSPPGDASSLLVVEGPGRLQLVDGAGRTLFADLSGRVSFSGERAMLSAAFSPDYAQSGLLYVFYTATDGDTIVEELRRDPLNPRRADPGYSRVVLRIGHPLGNHWGGQVAFGGDGYLYAATGDGGGSNDPGNNGQNTSTLLGKLLRINPVAGNGCGGACTIPPDNPFVAGGGAPEVWAYGLRNPWRFSFDRASGDLVLADVGQDEWEEINLLRAATGGGRGANFGWDCMEGTSRNAADSCPEPANHTGPVIQQPNTPWVAITGGVVVRDPNVPSLGGRFLFTDYPRTEPILAAVLGSDQGTATPLNGLGNTTSISEDACARVYVTDIAGSVRRVVENAGGGCAGPAPLPPAFAGASRADYTPLQLPPPTAPVGALTTQDTSPPRVSLLYGRRQRTLRTRRIRLSVRCNERCRVRITGKAGPRRRSLPVKRRTLPANAHRRFTIKLSRRLTRRLRRDQRRSGKRVVARLRLRATDAAGNTRTRRLTIRLKR